MSAESPELTPEAAQEAPKKAGLLDQLKAMVMGKPKTEASPTDQLAEMRAQNAAAQAESDATRKSNLGAMEKDGVLSVSPDKRYDTGEQPVVPPRSVPTPEGGEPTGPVPAVPTEAAPESVEDQAA